jgi:acyl CoA:acetate/3-ketoacid CoA transferase beta subunit/acyl CoA:acetate/3-ketoacid CoA transferase alpha subunit
VYGRLLVEHLGLEEAVATHVRPGDTVYVGMGHHRWTAAARELARQRWGTGPGLTLAMLSLSSLGVLFFRGGLVRKVVTAYSGDSFPTYAPNPVYQRAYASGDVELEHWSFLAFQQRLEAAARGLPAMVTRSLRGSSMAANDGYAEADTPFGRVGLVAPFAPDVVLMHALAATPEGDVVLAPPVLEGAWAALAARRGAVVTVERVVEDRAELAALARLPKLPAHRVLAIAEVPFGAHPGGVYAHGLPVAGYGEDIPFWTVARDAGRGDVDAFCREWCLDVPDQDAYLAKLGAGRLDRLRARAHPESWRDDEAARPVDEAAPVTGPERAATWAARELVDRIEALGADAVLAAAGLAKLAAWVGVARAVAAGRRVRLTAEVGLWGYTPTPADPFIFNHRSFPSAVMLTDSSAVLGLLVGGPGTTTIGCLGAGQVDRFGNVNSTVIPGGPFLVGSGGGNDVFSGAAECIVVTLLTPNRTPPELGYVTGPGDRVRAVVTDQGVLRKGDGGELSLAAVAAGEEPLEERVRRAVACCGWDLRVDRHVAELAPPTPDEVLALRRYDPEGLFLRA